MTSSGRFGEGNWPSERLSSGIRGLGLESDKTILLFNPPGAFFF